MERLRLLLLLLLLLLVLVLLVLVLVLHPTAAHNVHTLPLHRIIRSSGHQSLLLQSRLLYLDHLAELLLRLLLHRIR